MHFPQDYTALHDNCIFTKKDNQTAKLWSLLVADGKPVEPTGQFGKYPT